MSLLLIVVFVVVVVVVVAYCLPLLFLTSSLSAFTPYCQTSQDGINQPCQLHK